MTILPRSFTHQPASVGWVIALAVRGVEPGSNASSLAGCTQELVKWGRKEKLLETLDHPGALQAPPALLASAAVALEGEASRTGVGARLAESLAGYAELRFGKDDFVVLASGWDFASVRTTLTVDGQTYESPKVSPAKNGATEVRFNVGELGSPLRSHAPSEVTLTLEAAGRTSVRLRLENAPSDPAIETENSWLPVPLNLGARQPAWRIAGVTIGEKEWKMRSAERRSQNE